MLILKKVINFNLIVDKKKFVSFKNKINFQCARNCSHESDCALISSTSNTLRNIHLVNKSDIIDTLYDKKLQKTDKNTIKIRRVDNLDILFMFFNNTKVVFSNYLKGHSSKKQIEENNYLLASIFFNIYDLSFDAKYISLGDDKINLWYKLNILNYLCCETHLMYWFNCIKNSQDEKDKLICSQYFFLLSNALDHNQAKLHWIFKEINTENYNYKDIINKYFLCQNPYYLETLIEASSLFDNSSEYINKVISKNKLIIDNILKNIFFELNEKEKNNILKELKNKLKKISSKSNIAKQKEYRANSYVNIMFKAKIEDKNLTNIYYLTLQQLKNMEIIENYLKNNSSNDILIKVTELYVKELKNIILLQDDDLTKKEFNETLRNILILKISFETLFIKEYITKHVLDLNQTLNNITDEFINEIKMFQNLKNNVSLNNLFFNFFKKEQHDELKEEYQFQKDVLNIILSKYRDELNANSFFLNQALTMFLSTNFIIDSLKPNSREIDLCLKNLYYFSFLNNNKNRDIRQNIFLLHGSLHNVIQCLNFLESLCAHMYGNTSLSTLCDFSKKTFILPFDSKFLYIYQIKTQQEMDKLFSNYKDTELLKQYFVFDKTDSVDYAKNIISLSLNFISFLEYLNKGNEYTKIKNDSVNIIMEKDFRSWLLSQKKNKLVYGVFDNFSINTQDVILDLLFFKLL